MPGCPSITVGPIAASSLNPTIGVSMNIIPTVLALGIAACADTGSAPANSPTTLNASGDCVRSSAAAASPEANGADGTDRTGAPCRATHPAPNSGVVPPNPTPSRFVAPNPTPPRAVAPNPDAFGTKASADAGTREAPANK
jgi:hypothetical protein